MANVPPPQFSYLGRERITNRLNFGNLDVDISVQILESALKSRTQSAYGPIQECL